jgi:hypothetical protein
LRYPIGFLDHSPRFGVDHQIFKQAPLDVDLMRQQVERWLGNAGRVWIKENADQFASMVRKVRVDVAGGTNA